MPCPRTPPPNEPNGYEKAALNFEVQCTATEKQVWQLVFGRRGIGDRARVLLNAEACRLAGLPVSEQFCDCKRNLDGEAILRLKAHLRKPGK